MRSLLLLTLVTALALPANATKRVTVEQLEQALTADSAAHRNDIEVARQIGDLELIEQLTRATLDRLTAKIPLGPKAALALQLLADRSAFLDPPVSELPAAEPPDAAAQQHMLDAARGYVVQTTPHLIDFFAIRTTYRFDDSPQVLVQGSWPVRAGLHMVGWSSEEVTLRDGKESRSATRKTNAVPTAIPQEQQEKGLSSWGEFGPALAVVLTDTAKGNVSWSHWEKTPAGLAAVFHYSVPRSASHYAVSYCCVLGDPSTMDVTPPGVGGGAGGLKIPRAYTFNATPGYHGSLAVDPATGAILHITIEAEMKAGSPLARAATLIEYGPIRIGDRSFICPLRALAISMEEPQGHPISALDSNQTNAPKMLLNETQFSEYHRLATMARIVSSEAPAGPQDGAAQPPSPAAAIDSPSVAAVAEPQPQAAPVIAQPAPTPATAPEPFDPEFSLSAASGVPDEPAGVPLPRNTDVTLKFTARLVDLSVVAYDKKGHPVRDLKQDDFEIYDNGRKQEIRSFSQFTSDGNATPAGPEQADKVFSNRTADAAAVGPATRVPEAGATILLIDESHIAWSDLNNARAQMLQFLGSLPPGERVGLYSMTGLGFHVLTEITTDHAALIARLQKWMPTAQSVSQAQEEEVRNRQQINEVHNMTDLLSVNGNTVDEKSQKDPVDYQLRDLGANPARDALIILRGVARRLAGIPGHKNLVWVSSDNVFADWTNQAVDTEKGSKGLDSFALRAQEAMNEAHAAVYPFDVSQLAGGAVTADMQHRNVELAPVAQDPFNIVTPEQQEIISRGKNSGRVTAQMRQDVHPIQEPIQQVAEATGGRTIRRSGDLATALAGIVEDGHATYQLSFSPPGPADDQYHKITVKPLNKRGLTLRYRTGYLYAKEPATLKEGFHEAIWQPQEMDQVAVTAKVDAQSSGATVRIKIAAGDLGLQKQDTRWADNLDIFFIQRDDAGLHAQIEGQTLGLRLKLSTYQGLLTEGIPFDHFVQLKPGMDSLRVLVVDRNSGRMGSVTIPATAISQAR
jgi:VWFA-related protein